MRYLVVGVGNFGKTVAEVLSANKYEVIAVDSDERRVDDIKDKVSAAFILNATDPIALSSLPMGDIDCAIVSICQCIEHSLRIVAILKNMKVQKLYVRAIDEMHAMILKAMGIDKILYPEEFAGRYLAENLMKGVDVEVK